MALPRAGALESLRRLRSPAWAAALPGFILVGTFAPLSAHSFALAMVVVSVLAMPPLVAVAILGVLRGPRGALIALALVAAVLATLAGGWSRELSATLLTALGALAAGAALARLIPPRWLLAGFTCMCAIDVALVAAGVGQPAGAVIAQAAGGLPGPLFDHAQVGRVALDYPDLVLAGALGGFVAGQRGQRRAAALVTVLAAVCLVLAPRHSVFPETMPVALTLIALRFAGLPRAEEPVADELPAVASGPAVADGPVVAGGPVAGEPALAEAPAVAPGLVAAESRDGAGGPGLPEVKPLAPRRQPPDVAPGIAAA